jgi:hypothetical protein
MARFCLRSGLRQARRGSQLGTQNFGPQDLRLQDARVRHSLRLSESSFSHRKRAVRPAERLSVLKRASSRKKRRNRQREQHAADADLHCIGKSSISLRERAVRRAERVRPTGMLAWRKEARHAKRAQHPAHLDAFCVSESSARLRESPACLAQILRF